MMKGALVLSLLANMALAFVAAVCRQEVSDLRKQLTAWRATAERDELELDRVEGPIQAKDDGHNPFSACR